MRAKRAAWRRETAQAAQYGALRLCAECGRVSCLGARALEHFITKWILQIGVQDWHRYQLPAGLAPEPRIAHPSPAGRPAGGRAGELSGTCDAP